MNHIIEKNKLKKLQTVNNQPILTARTNIQSKYVENKQIGMYAHTPISRAPQTSYLMLARLGYSLWYEYNYCRKTKKKQG